MQSSPDQAAWTLGQRLVSPAVVITVGGLVASDDICIGISDRGINDRAINGRDINDRAINAAGINGRGTRKLHDADINLGINPNINLGLVVTAQTESEHERIIKWGALNGELLITQCR